MRRGGDARVADQPEDLSSFDALADVHADAAGLHVRVKRVPVSAQVLYHAIAGHVVKGGKGWFGGRSVLGHVIANRDNGAGRRREHLVAVNGVALVAQRITVEDVVARLVEANVSIA